MTPPLSNFPKNSSILVWPSVPMRLTCYYEWMAKRNESTSELLWRGCYYHFCYHHWDSFYLYHNCHCHWYFYLYHSLSCYHCYLVVVPQSSTAAPVEEAAQALRVKRQDGGDILNGCDPNTAIGGFLLFPLFRAICAERGFEDHGAYGKWNVEKNWEIYKIPSQTLISICVLLDLYKKNHQKI